MIWVVVLKMSDIVLVVTCCFDTGYAATDDPVWVVSLVFPGRCAENVFTTTEEVGIFFFLVCAIEDSLVLLTVVVFSVLKTLAVEYLGTTVGGMTVRVCKGADTLACVEVVDVLKSNAKDLVNVKDSAVKFLVLVLDVDISGGVVVLIVEVFKNVAGSLLVVPGGTLRVSVVVLVIFSVVNASSGGRVLVSNLAEVENMSMLRATEEFVLMVCDGGTVALRVVIVPTVILEVKESVVGIVMVLGIEPSNLAGNKDVFIDSTATGMVEAVLGIDKRVELCLVTVMEAELLGSG